MWDVGWDVKQLKEKNLYSRNHQSSLSGTTGFGVTVLSSILPTIPAFSELSSLCLLRFIQVVLHPQLSWLACPWHTQHSLYNSRCCFNLRLCRKPFLLLQLSESPALRTLQSTLDFPHNHCHNRLCFNLWQQRGLSAFPAKLQDSQR